MIARFTRAPRAQVDAACRALPNLEARSYRNEQLNRRLRRRPPTRKGALTACSAAGAAT